jgi:undecaprenyl-diphosphatase
MSIIPKQNSTIFTPPTAAQIGTQSNSRYTPAIMEMKTLLGLDASLSQRLRLDAAHTGLKKLAAFLAHSGDSWFWAAGLGLVWLLTAGNDWRMRSALMLIGVVGLALLVLGIKFTIRRKRPEGDWGAIYRNTDPHSFPSGHAARAFMLAVMALSLGPAWFGALVAVWAPLVSLARVAMGLHYLSDVAAGLLVGILAGLVMVWIAPVLVTLLPFLF